MAQLSDVHVLCRLPLDVIARNSSSAAAKAGEIKLAGPRQQLVVDVLAWEDTCGPGAVRTES